MFVHACRKKEDLTQSVTCAEKLSEFQFIVAHRWSVVSSWCCRQVSDEKAFFLGHVRMRCFSSDAEKMKGKPDAEFVLLGHSDY
jgi:hypothetical protein